jgi:dUTP pyrophosphatase
MLYGYDTTEAICAELSEENRKLKEGKRMDKVKVVLDEGAVMPTRGHSTDAGLDLYAREDKVIPGRGSAVFDTGVHIELGAMHLFAWDGLKKIKTVGFLKSKSGLNVKHGITGEGVIDMGYTGSITVKLYNNSDKDYTVCKGDKISQLVILPVLTPDLERVEELKGTDRGDNGFGSTGR